MWALVDISRKGGDQEAARTIRGLAEGLVVKDQGPKAFRDPSGMGGPSQLEMILQFWRFQVPGEKASQGWGVGHLTRPGLAASCQNCILEGRSVLERHLRVPVSGVRGDRCLVATHALCPQQGSQRCVSCPGL